MAKKKETDSFSALLQEAQARRPNPRTADAEAGSLYENAKQKLQALIENAVKEQGYDHPDVQEMRRLAHILLR